MSNGNFFASVAPYLSNPLIVVGFLLFLLFGLYRAMIAGKILQPVSANQSSAIVLLILRYGFWISVLVIIAGFGLAFYRAFNDPIQAKQAKIDSIIESLDNSVDISFIEGALERIKYVAVQSISDRDYITAALWQLLRQIKTVDTAAYRIKRDKFLQYFKKVYDNDLRYVFASENGVDGDFGWVDLQDSDLSNVNFSKSFFLDATFEMANLTGAKLDSSYVAMVRVHGTDFSDTSMDEVDWFNMFGITKTQLQQIKPETLMECPGEGSELNEENFIDYIDAYYAFGFYRWTHTGQEKLRHYWKEYIQEDGLCALAKYRRAKARQSDAPSL